MSMFAAPRTTPFAAPRTTPFAARPTPLAAPPTPFAGPPNFHAGASPKPHSAIAVTIAGDMDISTVPRLREELGGAVAARPDTVVVDLSDCPFVDATAMTLLLETHRQACRSGVRLCLQGCSPRVLRLLSLTKLRGVFDLAP